MMQQQNQKFNIQLINVLCLTKHSFILNYTIPCWEIVRVGCALCPVTKKQTWYHQSYPTIKWEDLKEHTHEVGPSFRNVVIGVS